MRPRYRSHLPALGLAIFLCSSIASAQEHGELGRMWTFENPPLAYLEKEYGFKPDRAWLNKMRLAALRLGDKNRGWCSASFVSPRGLIMTNHHCVRNALGVSQGGESWVKNGFYATSLEDEVRLKSESGNDVWATQLVATTDVTAKVNAGIAKTDDDAAIKKKRDENKKNILDEAEKKNPDGRHEIVTLYQGAIFQLYEYKTYKDIRVVCTPHLQTAHFGGDPDNFTYPRYSIDFAFVRAYDDGKPADTTKSYFKWKMGGAKEGDLVFIPGNPGSTQRLYTKAQMEYERDKRIPMLKERFDQQLALLRSILRQWGPRLGPRFEAQIKNWVLQYENGQKAFGGELSGLRDEKLMAQKDAAEKAFRKRVGAKRELRKRYGQIWDRLAEVAEKRKALEAKLRFQTHDYCRPLRGAVLAVRAKDPQEPEDKRKEFEKQLLSQPGRTLQDSFLSAPMFVNHVQRAKEWLSEDDPFFADVLDGKSGRDVVRAVTSSRIAQQDFRKGLMDGGWEAIQKSEDPAVVIARKLAPLMRANEQKDEELRAIEEAQGALLGQALFACYGTSVSPDATMTLRFSDGVVKGYPCNGTIAPYRTTFYGLFGRNIDFGNKHPFDLPEPWLENREKIDLTKSVNFVSTNDITGGNSGSVVVSKELKVVGLVFDGNIESLPNNYVFRDDIPRSVSVHVDAILEAMKKIYEAERVVAELTGQ
ncbi:MAG: S46 family peptidase [Planctomycetota bacterium]